MEVEKSAEEYSKGELRRQLYASLRSTGVLDSMKGQLRARLLEHLRHHNEDLTEPKKKQRKPSLIERLLSSLFLDYLESNGFTFTVSVFMPESQMASWPPFSYEEMLELLHLDPSSDLHIRLKLLGGEGRECLAYQLVTVLQQMANRSSIQEVSTQTSPAEVCKRALRTSCTSPKELESSIKEIEVAYIRKKEAHDAHRALPHRSLEDKLTVLHQEFDARVNAEVALQVSRIRDYEINAARMDEAARYRRQLARDREELEDIHKSRMDRVKAREESLVERMLSKEKAIEASAYEQRQKILLEITSLRERENKLRQFKESQERREEKLNEREFSLRAKEEEVVLERKALYAQADEIAASRRNELKEQYNELCDRLYHDQTLLGAEREQLKEEKVVMAIELAASRSDKELIQALHRRLSVEEDQRLKLDMSIRELEEKLKQQTSSAPALASFPDQRLEERLRELQADLEQERLQRQASEKENKTLERKLQKKKVELATARTPQGEWITEHKNLMATIYKQEAELQKKETKLQLMETEKEKLTNRHKKLLLKIDHLDTIVKKAQEEKDHAVYNLEILQVQQTTNERELLETTKILRKAQQALETERLEHCALRSHMNTVVSSTRNDLKSVTPERDYISQDKLERSSDLFDPKSSVAVPFGKKWESSQKKPKPESHELWTQLLSENAAKKAPLDQDLESTSVNHFVTPSISKSPSAGNGEAKSSNSTDMNGLTAITVEKLKTVQGGIRIVTNTKALMETVFDGSIEGFTSSWDQEKYGEYSYEDAIPRWRKAYLAEVGTPASWNHGHNDSVSSVQGLVTNLQCNRGEVHIGDCSSGKDPMLCWDKTFFERGGEMAEECANEELLSDVLATEVTTEFRSASMLEINSPSANLQNLENSDTPVGQIEFSNLNISEGKEEYSLEPWKKERRCLEMEDVANRVGDRDLSVHDIAEVVTHTAHDDDEHVERQGAESLWNPYLGEQEKNAKHNSEAEKDLSQDSLSCKCMPSLNYDLESLEESTQSRDGILMSNSCGPQMDSHSESDQHTTVDSATEYIHKKPTMIPEMKYSRLLNISPENHVDIRDCKYMKCEEIKDIQHHSRSKTDCQTFEENKTTQGNRSTAEVIGNEAREKDAADEGELIACEQVPWEPHGTHELVKLTNKVNEVTMEITSRAPTMRESEELASVGSDDIDRDLSHLISRLGLTVTITEDQEKGSYKKVEKNLHEKVLSPSPVDSQQEGSRGLLHENRAPAIGRMSGLPEIGRMLYKQEIHEREKAQKDLQGQLLLYCTTEGQNPTERVEMKDNRDINLDPQQLSKLPDYDTHALETLRSSIVIRKQEVPIDKETDKECPKVMDWAGSHKSPPNLVLAIRNNQLVKLGKQDEFQKWDKITSVLGTSHPEAVMDTKSTRDESICRKETSHLVDERSPVQQARDPGHALVSHRGTDSSSEGSAYKGDSFEEEEEEEEDQVDEKPTYSEESCFVQV